MLWFSSWSSFGALDFLLRKYFYNNERKIKQSINSGVCCPLCENKCFVVLGDPHNSQIQRGFLWGNAECRHGGLHPPRKDLQLTRYAFSSFTFPPRRLPFPYTRIPLWRCVSYVLVRAEALISAINSDIEEAKVQLELPEHRKLKEDNFFTSRTSSSSASPPSTASTSQTIINGHWQPGAAAANTNLTTWAFIIKLLMNRLYFLKRFCI